MDVSRETSIMSDDRAGVHSPTTAMAPRCEQRWTVVAGFPYSSLVGRISGGASRRDKRAGRFGGSSLLGRCSTFYTRVCRTAVSSFVHSGPSWAVSGGECADMGWGALCWPHKFSRSGGERGDRESKGGNVASSLREHASAAPSHDEHLAVLAFHVKHHAGPGA